MTAESDVRRLQVVHHLVCSVLIELTFVSLGTELPLRELLFKASIGCEVGALVLVLKSQSGRFVLVLAGFLVEHLLVGGSEFSGCGAHREVGLGETPLLLTHKGKVRLLR